MGVEISEPVAPTAAVAPAARRRIPPGLASFLPAALVVALWILWIPLDGGYFPRVWYPSAIGLVALLAVVVVSARRVLPASRAARAALALLAALVVWNFLSIAWAASAGSALQAADGLLLLLVGVWIVGLTPWTPASATVALGVWAIGVTVVCAVILIEAVGASDLSPYLITLRWSEPLGYSNATAAMASVACWPALLIAVRERTPAVLQVCALVVATFLVEFSLIPQSRGSMAGIVVGLLVFAAVMPNRLRLLSRLAVIGAAVSLSAGAIFDVYDAGARGHHVIPALHHAARSIALTLVAVAAAGVVLALIERRMRPSEAVLAVARRSLAGVLVVAALVGAALAIANSGRIADSASNRWHTFKSGADTTIITGPRLIANHPDQRYDYWRVALNVFRSAPVIGVGAGNYERRYTAERRLSKHAQFTHDIWLRWLAENGAVGLVLFVGFFGLTLSGAAARCRRLDPARRGVIAACLAIGAYFLVHASFDWLDEYPAIAAPAFALPVLALVLARARRARPAPRAQQSPAAHVPVAAAVGVAVAALVALVPAYLATRYVDRASRVWRADEARAFRDLSRAASLNPLAVEPYLSEGTIASDLGDTRRAEVAFRKALTIEDNWYAHFELALIDAQAGRFGAARAQLARASALNAHDFVIAAARQQIHAGHRVNPGAINSLVFSQTLYRKQRVT